MLKERERKQLELRIQKLVKQFVKAAPLRLLDERKWEMQIEKIIVPLDAALQKWVSDIARQN
jgi:hypothetical protein